MTSDRTPRPCPYCNFVYYSKSTYTAHINAEHWKELEEEEDAGTESEEDQ